MPIPYLNNPSTKRRPGDWSPPILPLLLITPFDSLLVKFLIPRRPGVPQCWSPQSHQCWRHWPCHSRMAPHFSQSQHAAFYSSAFYCTPRYCTTQYCTARYCTAWHCTARHCTSWYCIARHCFARYCVCTLKRGGEYRKIPAWSQGSSQGQFAETECWYFPVFPDSS